MQESLYQIFPSQCSEHDNFLLSLEICLQKLKGDGAQGLAIVGDVKKQGGVDHGWTVWEAPGWHRLQGCTHKFC